MLKLASFVCIILALEISLSNGIMMVDVALTNSNGKTYSPIYDGIACDITIDGNRHI
jgi:hypothetical protein